MSFKEVQRLRKSGKLEDALAIANEDLEKDQLNIWNKRSIAWVYYEFLKLHSNIENIDKSIDFLTKLKALELPEDESMIFDSFAFQIGKLIFNLGHEKHIDFIKLNSIFETIKNFHFSKPSEGYSFLHKAFHKGHKGWSRYLEFADWWNFDNFRTEDYLPEIYNDQKLMSLVEQGYIAYSKKLFEGTIVQSNETYHNHQQKEVKIHREELPLAASSECEISLAKTIDKEKVQSFLPKLDLIIEKHPEYQYPQYYKAKLLLALGGNDDILANFIPFALKNRNKFWVWEVLADIYPNKNENKLSCLCKALSLKNPDEFTIKTRQKLAELLISLNKFKEAKTEIQKIISIRKENNWGIPEKINEWTKQKWYLKIQSNKDNKAFYSLHLRNAEDILYTYIPEETVAIEFVNEDKAMLSFIQSRTKHGFFKYAGLIDNPKIGDLLKVRFANNNNKDDYYKILSAKLASKDDSCEAIKEFNGILKIKSTASFGFVEDIFIHPTLIVKHELDANTLISGKAILSYNKKQNQWGWKAFEILSDSN